MSQDKPNPNPDQGAAQANAETGPIDKGRAAQAQAADAARAEEVARKLVAMAEHSQQGSDPTRHPHFAQASVQGANVAGLRDFFDWVAAHRQDIGSIVQLVLALADR